MPDETPAFLSRPISRRAWLAWAASAAATPLLAGCSSGSSTDTPRLTSTVEWGRQAIREAMQQTQTRAVSVALLYEDQLVWQEGFGTRDPAGLQATTVDTRFNIGSVSKVLAALAVMVLVDRGQVVLDAPVTRYLKDFRMRSPEYADITVRHLLSHSSGLPGTHFHNIFAFEPLSGYAQELEAALADVHLKHAPGAMAVYCNDGFTMVERVVRAVTGMPYTDFVQSALLDPLGMTRSGYPLEPLPSGSVAQVDVDGTPKGQEFVMGYATGGLSTTPGDMMKLASMFLRQGRHDGSRIVSGASIAEMGTAQNRDVRIELTPEWRWGLGWDGVRHPGLDAVGILGWQKNGGTAFFTTEFFVLPEMRMALLLTGNNAAFSPGPLAENILLRALQEGGHIAALPPPVSVQLPPPSNTPTPDLEALAGVYGHSDAPYKVGISGTSQLDLLIWSGPEQTWTPLAPGLQLRADGWWYADAKPEVQYRWAQADGKRYLLTRQTVGAGHYRLSLPLGQQMPAADSPLPPAWRALVGSAWQVVNEHPQSVWASEVLTPITLTEHPELPGYLFWDERQFLKPLGDHHAGMTVQVPLNAGRDLVELVLEHRDGTQWLRTGGWLLRRLS